MLKNSLPEKYNYVIIKTLSLIKGRVRDEKFLACNKLQGRLSKILESPFIVGKEHHKNVNHR